MRYLIIGSKALTEGFGVLGFETFPQATIEQMENLLLELLKRQEQALVIIENTLTHHPTTPHEPLPIVARVRREAAWLILSEIPPLNQPATYRPTVETLITRILGEQVLTP